MSKSYLVQILLPKEQETESRFRNAGSRNSWKK